LKRNLFSKAVEKFPDETQETCVSAVHIWLFRNLEDEGYQVEILDSS